MTDSPDHGMGSLIEDARLVASNNRDSSPFVLGLVKRLADALSVCASDKERLDWLDRALKAGGGETWGVTLVTSRWVRNNVSDILMRLDSYDDEGEPNEVTGDDLRSAIDKAMSGDTTDSISNA